MTAVCNDTVLYLAPSLDPRNGSGRMGYEIVRRVRERTAVKALVTSQAKASGLEELRELEPSRRAGNFIRNCFRARRAASDARVVHALDGWPYGIYGLCAVFGTSRLLVISGIGTYSVAPLRLGGIRRFLLAAAYRRAAKIPCISAYTEQQIRKELPWAHTAIVHPGLTALAEPAPAVCDAFRKHAGLRDDAHPIVLTVGAIKERKGQLDTLYALQRLQGMYPRITYVMVGEPEPNYAESIRAFASENGLEDRIRIITDVVSDAELAAAYSIADVFVLASNNDGLHFEGFGLVVLEAAQFGVPAVGTRGNGIEDAIADNVSGLLVNQKDPAGIANALGAVLANRESFARGARALSKTFSWDETVGKLCALYGVATGLSSLRR